MSLITQRYKSELEEIKQALYNYWNNKHSSDIRKRRWAEMIDKVLEDTRQYDEMYGTQYVKIIEKRFFEELGWRQICEELNIEKSTKYDLEKEILNFILMESLKRGYFQYKENAG